jgi:hypothetical protein
LEGLWSVIDTIAFDVAYLALLAFGCSAESACFADGEGFRVDVGRQAESGGEKLEW